MISFGKPNAEGNRSFRKLFSLKPFVRFCQDLSDLLLCYIFTENGPRKLQRFASVKKTVEMYERLSVAAAEARSKGFTLWRKKSFKSSQKPENGKKTSEKSS